MFQPFDEFMQEARAMLRGKDHAEQVAEFQHKESAANESAWFWKNFSQGIRRLLPSAVAEYLPTIDGDLPITRHPEIELLLPGCLMIKIFFWTDANGIPQFRDNSPFLVPGTAIHLEQTELIWGIEKGALYQPVFIDNLKLAAAMAEDRSLSLWHTGHLANKPELTYGPDPDHAIDPDYSIWDETFGEFRDPRD
jgi:hypothetical protein